MIFLKRLLRTNLLLQVFVCLLLPACQQTSGPGSNRPDNATQTSEISEPTIEASPTSKAGDQWEVLTAPNVTLKVTAPEGKSVKILYRPAFAEGRHVELKKPTSQGGTRGEFSTQFKVPSDFAGEVWAEVSYANGTKKETKPISLTVEAISPDELADASYKHSEDSARSDKLTGGRIEQTTLQPGQGNIRITVNIPAFQLTLWQGGKEVKTYQIGIGRREFPLPDGLRHANQIIFNPDWVPPDSSWVEEHDVVPGERVEADDPRNPLGKIKIPIGGSGILIHQAFKPSDIGHLVSHGCVRVKLDELYELIDKIVAARSISVSRTQLEHARNSKDRFVIKLDAPIVVDISYDTQVVEGGVLHLYPDVYNKKVNNLENIRAELKDAGVDDSSIDDKMLQRMLDRVTMTEQFAVSLADLKAGHAVEMGKNQPLTAVSVPKKQSGNSGKKQRSR
jgi:lipoprotein-anchoring transpeptidase ErfK/SrfK